MVISPRSKQTLHSVPTATAESMAIENHASSMAKVAEALVSVSQEIRLTREANVPVHEFYKAAYNSLDCIGDRLKKWGPWTMASIPFVIPLINGISPQMAKLIQALVTTATNTQVP